MPTIDDYRWLVSEIGCEWLVRCQADARLTAKGASRLRRHLSTAQAHVVLEQIELRQRAARRFDQADRLFFTARSLQQATDSRLAAYKAERFESSEVFDLCCGIGGDLLALGRRVPVRGIESDPIVAVLAAANCCALDLPSVQITVGDAMEIEVPTESAIHVDPDRRPDGKRSVSLSRHVPDLTTRPDWRTHSGGYAIKLAPGTLADDPFFSDAELEWIGHSRECQQLVAWFGPLARQPGRRTATVLGKTGQSETLAQDISASLHFTTDVAKYLMEPAASVLAAGLSATLAARYQLQALTAGGGYLTGNQRVTSPWHTTFSIVDACAFREKNIRQMLKAHNIGQVEVKKRGVEIDTSHWQRRLTRAEGKPACLFILPLGRRTATLLANRLEVEEATSATSALSGTELSQTALPVSTECDSRTHTNNGHD